MILHFFIEYHPNKLHLMRLLDEMALSGSVVFAMGFILAFIRGTGCSQLLDVYKKCTQTPRNSLYSTPTVIIPQRANATEVLVNVQEHGSLEMGLCPNSRFLKISWFIKQPQDSDVMLCFKMENRRNGNIMETVCYNLHIHESHHTSAMDCWFPVDVIANRPIIKAWTLPPTAPSDGGTLYGSLDTSALDFDNSCKDICEVVTMRIGSKVKCQHTASIVHDKTAFIKHLSFSTSNTSKCNNSMNIIKEFDNKLEYQLNCSLSGIGYMKILYNVEGKYCLKYQMVTVTCPNGTSSNMALTNGLEDTHSFGTFMIFGLVCILVIGATFFSVVFVIQWVYGRMHYIKSQHRRHSEPAGTHHVNFQENFPLTTFGSQPSGSRTPRVVHTDFQKSPTRQRSASLFSDKMPEEENEKQRLLVLPMRKSITMALLEETDLFYKKRILLLPIPFDHFTNDVTKILKSVFMNEAGIPSQCCFDRKIFQEYITGDRFRWIENVLGDHDKILIFLCFTTDLERVGTKRDSMAEEILDNILVTKVKSHRLCKVILLYLTDSPDSVQKTGDIITDSFHISSSVCYKNFISNIMNFCGRNALENPDLITRLTTCKASKHFLKFIGVKDS